jgi:signal transduction histidine kinase/DNA-binding response OmpR family regulator
VTETSIPIVQIALRTERDVVHARQKAREVAAALGLDNQDQIRMATAASEMARNAFRYARSGKVSFLVKIEAPQSLQIVITDGGPGIANIDDILDGRYRSQTGLGKGIIGTRRLMDDFEIETSAQGTTVRLSKHIPKSAASWVPQNIQELQRGMQRRVPDDPYAEIERQNQELLKTLQELRTRHEEMELLNRELEDTNRGVVALYAELDERADYLRRASELKTNFLSNVSHEFRTPLNSIISLSRLLMDGFDGELSAEQRKQVHFIESSARDLQEMVNDLLDLAKVEAGKIRIRPKRFEVHELFSALKGMLKPLLADNTSVELVFEDASSIEPLHTDEGKVSQILRNLISNALKFTPQGSVNVSARELPHGRVEFTVADTGIGIPFEYHETIFQEFSQVENPLQERHRGTGLGLPLCRNLATLLGGQISVQSELGRGSVFSFAIPSIYVGEAVTQEDSATLPVPEFYRATVLYLEDDETTAHNFEAILRHTEFQPILASSIAQAEHWISRHKPAAVVVEIHIGDDTAWSFIEQLREHHRDVPIVATGAFDESLSARSHCTDLFLPKPLERESLLNSLRQLTSGCGTRKLFLVDDNEVSRYIVRELLSQPWLQIEEVSNGKAVLQKLHKQVPDAMILDLLMPDVSGFEVLRQLRANPQTAALPVLVYTSKPLSDSEKAQLTAWNASVVRKEDVSTRLSARPFIDWLAESGVSPLGRS